MFIHLSMPSKMPCPAWSLPTSMCISGQRYIRDGALLNKPYVCRICYANMGPSTFPVALIPLQQNWEAYASNPQKWVREISQKIWAECNCLYFRWFHCGDIQSPDMLGHIMDVAERCPRTSFWLPTIESTIVKTVADVRTVPTNLTIRVSSPEVDLVPSEQKTPGICNSMVSYQEKWTCPAHTTGNQCKTCRACWDRNVKIVAYPMHAGCHLQSDTTARRIGLI